MLLATANSWLSADNTWVGVLAIILFIIGLAFSLWFMERFDTDNQRFLHNWWNEQLRGVRRTHPRGSGASGSDSTTEDDDEAEAEAVE